MATKIVPWTDCPCGKRGFEDQHDADKALGRARAKRLRMADKGGTRRGAKVENRTYDCPLTGLLHLTNQSRRAYQSRELVAA